LIDKAALKEMWKFGGNLMGFAAINYWARQVDDLLVGRLFGAAPLGVYNRAYGTMLMPLQQVSSVVGRVMFPAMSKLQGNIVESKRICLQSLSSVALISAPLMLLLWVVAEPFIQLLYGDKWLDVVPLLKVLCFVGLFQSLGSLVGWIYMAQGRTKTMFRWGSFAALVIIVSIGVGVYLGSLQAIVNCYAVATVLLAYPQFAIPGKYIGMSVTEVVRAVAAVVVCAALAAVAAQLSARLVAAPNNALLLALQLAVGIVTYVALLLVFRVAAFQRVVVYAQPRLMALRPFGRRGG
ncbi:MAG TPA: hypothetical protein ENK23_07800, partial [Sorangium sp.]|nr:hypothetical protein [Sorangium sp.]